MTDAPVNALYAAWSPMILFFLVIYTAVQCTGWGSRVQYSEVQCRVQVSRVKYSEVECRLQVIIMK